MSWLYGCAASDWLLSLQLPRLTRVLAEDSPSTHGDAPEALMPATEALERAVRVFTSALRTMHVAFTTVTVSTAASCAEASETAGGAVAPGAAPTPGVATLRADTWDTGAMATAECLVRVLGVLASGSAAATAAAVAMGAVPFWLEVR